jgi:hypothetical protein
MTLSIWSFGKDLPKDTNTAGLQYITWDVEGVDKIAKARNAKIDRPLSAPVHRELSGCSIRTESRTTSLSSKKTTISDKRPSSQYPLASKGN